MPRVSIEYEQNRQKQIITGAARVFAANGYRQTTIDQVCQALQLSKGALYGYFKSKEELYVAVLASIFEARFAALTSAFDANDPLPVKFEKILDRLANLVVPEDDTLARLSVESFLESRHIPALQAAKTASYQRFSGFLLELMQEGQRSGEIDPQIDLPSLVAVLTATTDGLMMHSLVQGRGIDPQHVRRIFTGVFSPIPRK